VPLAATGPASAATTATTASAAASDRPIRRRSVTLDGLCTVVGSLAGALGLTWLVYERLLPLSGAFGFWSLFFALFLLLTGVSTALLWGGRAVADRIATAIMVTVGLLIVFVIVDEVAYTVYKGHQAITHWSFFSQDALRAAPLDPITTGGVWHAVVGSLEQMGIATLVAVPLGVLAALFLVEVGGPMARPVRSLIEAMTSLPEIVAGLFIYALLILTFGMRQCGFCAAMALTIMMIPFVARSSEVMLRLVPDTLREASYALGASQWRTVFTVVLPTARSGLTTAVVLGMARAIGETAPPLLTTGLNTFVNTNPFSGWQTDLPLYIFLTVQEPSPIERVRAFGAAVVLIALVLVLFSLARLLGGKAPGELTRRQRRRAARDRRAAALERTLAARLPAGSGGPAAPTPATMEGDVHASA
jgi:phosphate transport system permease protein